MGYQAARADGSIVDGSTLAPEEWAALLDVRLTCPVCGAAMACRRPEDARWHFYHLVSVPGCPNAAALESDAHHALKAAAARSIGLAGYRPWVEWVAPSRSFVADVAALRQDRPVLIVEAQLSAQRASTTTARTELRSGVAPTLWLCHVAHDNVHPWVEVDPDTWWVRGGAWSASGAWLMEPLDLFVAGILSGRVVLDGLWVDRVPPTADPPRGLRPALSTRLRTTRCRQCAQLVYRSAAGRHVGCPRDTIG